MHEIGIYTFKSQDPRPKLKSLNIALKHKIWSLISIQISQHPCCIKQLSCNWLYVPRHFRVVMLNSHYKNRLKIQFPLFPSISICAGSCQFETQLYFKTFNKIPAQRQYGNKIKIYPQPFREGCIVLSSKRCLLPFTNTHFSHE